MSPLPLLIYAGTLFVYPFAKMMNVTQIHETHKSHIEATQKPIRKPENLYPYRKIYVNYTYNNVLSKYTLTLKEKYTLDGCILYIYKYIQYTPLIYIKESAINSQHATVLSDMYIHMFARFCESQRRFFSPSLP